jgi:hypothetical protein
VPPASAHGTICDSLRSIHGFKASAAKSIREARGIRGPIFSPQNPREYSLFSTRRCGGEFLRFKKRGKLCAAVGRSRKAFLKRRGAKGRQTITALLAASAANTEELAKLAA